MTKLLASFCLWLALACGQVFAQGEISPGSRAIPAEVASLTKTDQVLQGGANVLSYNQGTITGGTYTVDCGLGPLQYQTNGGSFTLAAPVNDGSCMILSTNNASAGTITPSGFTVGSATGGTLTTTSTNKFTITVWRINGTSGYSIFAHQ